MRPKSPARRNPGSKAAKTLSTALPTALSGEDRALWEDVKGSIDPLDGRKRSGKNQHHAAASAASADGATSVAAPAGTALPRKRETVARDNLKMRKTKPLAPAAPRRLDRRAQRKIARGKTAIDSTLDLHGLTQAQAFSRLRSHIEAASRADQRCILVITGKGDRPNSGANGDPQADTGVLRRNLPDWLANQALGGLVSAIAPAGRAHGGDGAFYVRLRKQK